MKAGPFWVDSRHQRPVQDRTFCDQAAALWLPSEHRKLFLDGIVLAEGKGPAEG
jgi:hypothetical protein